jgi:hypothetical protein
MYIATVITCAVISVVWSIYSGIFTLGINKCLFRSRITKNAYMETEKYMLPHTDITYNDVIIPIRFTKHNAFLITEALIATAQQQF